MAIILRVCADDHKEGPLREFLELDGGPVHYEFWSTAGYCCYNCGRSLVSVLRYSRESATCPKCSRLNYSRREGESVFVCSSDDPASRRTGAR